MTRFTDAIGRKVVSTATAESVGKVHGFVVDPHGPVIAALELKKTESGDTLRWSDITAFGADAVTVSGTEKITDGGEDFAPLLAKANRVLGKRVLAATGDELGEVSDVEFDPDTGTVLAMITAAGEVEGTRLIGIGSYAVVVRAG